MNLDPNDLILFARIVEEGSFSRAAERLGLPNSTLSRRMSMLEAQLGERLLLRTTRKLTVTDFGHSVFHHAQQVAMDVEATVDSIQHRLSSPSGKLRISMPGDFTSDMLAPLLADFMAAYPAISLDIDVSQRRVDLIAENFDIAIRVGVLPDDATLAARRVASFRLGLYASPAYIERHGLPVHPETLMNHSALHLKTRAGDTELWLLTKGSETWQGAPAGRILANSPNMLKQLAMNGVGIACLTEHFVSPQIDNQELVPILNDWHFADIPVWAVFPGRRLMPSRTRLFIDRLIGNFEH
jgi:DNA-binding transcriptional LysR family regulator